MRGRATPASTGVTRPIHSDDSRGVRRGTGSCGQAPLAQDFRHEREQIGVREHIRAADLDLESGGVRSLGGLSEVLEHVVDSDRLGAISEPGGRDHRGQPLHQVAHGAVRLTAGADHHAGTEVHERQALVRERGRGGGATAEVLRALVTEPAEVNHALDALLLRHAREVRCGPTLALGEALAIGATSHRVDEVVGRRDALTGSAKAVRVEHVALVQLMAGVVEGGGAAAIAHQAAHLRAVLGERLGEAATNESGGPRYEYAHQAVVTRPCR
jgi:hypothetical protein